MDNEMNEVVITHFINPHLFWFRYAGKSENKKLEYNLQKLYLEETPLQKPFDVAVLDQVAVYILPWNKLLRAQIIKPMVEEFIVWLTDYGFPVCTNGKYLYILPEALTIPPSQVHCGGLVNLEPAGVKFDCNKIQFVMDKQKEWSPDACALFKNLLDYSISIQFIPKLCTNDNHRWGDLIIGLSSGERINVSDFLFENVFAMKVGKFRNKCLKYRSTKIDPWLDNNFNFNMEYNSLRGAYKVKVKYVENQICYIKTSAALRMSMVKKFASKENRPDPPPMEAFDMPLSQTFQKTGASNSVNTNAKRKKRQRSRNKQNNSTASAAKNGNPSKSSKKLKRS